MDVALFEALLEWGGVGSANLISGGMLRPSAQGQPQLNLSWAPAALGDDQMQNSLSKCTEAREEGQGGAAAPHSQEPTSDDGVFPLALAQHAAGSPIRRLKCCSASSTLGGLARLRVLGTEW